MQNKQTGEWGDVPAVVLWLTQLGDLSVEGAADCSPVEGQPGQAVMAHCVTTEQETRDLVSLEGEDVLTHTTLQHLGTHTTWWTSETHSLSQPLMRFFYRTGADWQFVWFHADGCSTGSHRDHRQTITLRVHEYLRGRCSHLDSQYSGDLLFLKQMYYHIYVRLIEAGFNLSAATFKTWAEQQNGSCSLTASAATTTLQLSC